MNKKNYARKIATAASAVIMALAFIPYSANAAQKGDANGDGSINVKDCCYIASVLAQGKGTNLTDAADYNKDGKKNILDASAIAMMLVNSGKASSNDFAPTSAASYANEILKLVNNERAKVGAAPLTLNTTLNSMANKRAKEIVNNFSHERPDGSSCFSIFDEYSMDYRCVGENIAAGSPTPSDTMDLWVNSEGHYKNIISKDFTELGVGYYYDAGSPYKYHWVQIFRTP